MTKLTSSDWSREAIARIIDEEAFRAEPEMQPTADMRQAVVQRRNHARAKADAILALSTQAAAQEGTVPDFLKRMTGELSPLEFPQWREDEGREGRREGAEEDDATMVPLTERMARAQSDMFNDMKARAEVAESQLADLTALVEEKDAVLLQCMAQFVFYAEQHTAKTPPDLSKARINAKFAQMCEAELQKTAKG